ncbi:MAG: 3-phosphoshikimate 1-carboxyvinyltransferase [Trueperella sp.]|nr:3-phosphoshikimate 1-carboxyvinyltransferase [Trueperella sp.]
MSAEFWAAPSAHAVTGKIALPGSKSLTNRYLVLAALGADPVTVHYPLLARDTELMIAALRTLGTEITTGTNSVTVTPRPWRAGQVDCGLAGTVMRFVPPLAALANGDTFFDGDPAARTRPMGTLVRALRDLGIAVDAASTAAGEPALPLTVHGTGKIAGGYLEIDATASSQFVSALLLCAPRMTHGLTLVHTGKQLPSTPHIEMTVAVLRAAGIEVQSAPGRWAVAPGIPQLTEVQIEPDLSNAGAFLAAALITGGQVQIPHWPCHTTQPGAKFLEIFAQMGGVVTPRPAVDSDSASYTAQLSGTGKIYPLDADLSAVGELVPTIAAVAAFADGTSQLRHIGQLRGHETNRLAAIVNELGKVGVRAREVGDGLEIIGQPALGQSELPPANISSGHGADLESYADHRMATFGAILGLRIPGVRVRNIETTAKTLPGFARQWEKLVAGELVEES